MFRKKGNGPKLWYTWKQMYLDLFVLLTLLGLVWELYSFIKAYPVEFIIAVISLLIIFRVGYLYTHDRKKYNDAKNTIKDAFLATKNILKDGIQLTDNVMTNKKVKEDPWEYEHVRKAVINQDTKVKPYDSNKVRHIKEGIDPYDELKDLERDLEKKKMEGKL